MQTEIPADLPVTQTVVVQTDWEKISNHISNGLTNIAAFLGIGKPDWTRVEV